MHRPLLPHHSLAPCPDLLHLLGVCSGDRVNEVLAMVDGLVSVIAPWDLFYPEVRSPLVRKDHSPWPVQRYNKL